VLNSVKSSGESESTSDKRNDEQKNTQTKEDSTPLNPPIGGNESKIKDSISTPKQRKRALRRRRRLRKRDIELIEKTRIEQEQEQQRKREMIEAYKEAQEQAPSILRGLLEEHSTQDKPTDEKSQKRSFWVASVLKFHGWIDEPLEKPPHVTQVSHLLDEQAQQESWDLRLNVFSLWQFLQRQ
jgi:hypothetical protein